MVAPITQYHVLTSDTSGNSEPVYFAELELLAVVPVVRVSNNNNNSSSSTDMDALEKRRSFADMKMVNVTNSSYHGSQVSQTDNLLLLQLELEKKVKRRFAKISQSQRMPSPG